MSRKSMRPAASRHTPGSHPKSCPICNPPKGEWTERWKERKGDDEDGYVKRVFQFAAKNLRLL